MRTKKRTAFILTTLAIKKKIIFKALNNTIHELIKVTINFRIKYIYEFIKLSFN